MRTNKVLRRDTFLRPVALKRCKTLTRSIAAGLCALAVFGLGEASAEESVAQAYKLYQQKRYKEAAQMFDLYANTPMPDPTICYYAALSNQAAGNTSRAKALYKQVVYLSPNSTVAQYAQSFLRKFEPGAQSSSFGSSYNPSPYSQNRAASSDGDGILSGPEEGSVYYRESNGQMWVPVEINNRSMEMELDTGAPTVFVGKNQLEQIGLRPPDGAAAGRTSGSSNNTMQEYWIMPVNLRVGPFTVANSPMQVLGVNYSSPLLGQSFLKFFDYTVDQSAKCIRLRRKSSSGSVAAKSGYPVPFTYQEGGNRIIVEVELNGKQVPMMLDTGNTACTVIFMSAQQAATYGCPPPPDATSKTHHGVSGSGRALEYTATRLKLGPIDRSNVRVSTNLDTPNDTEAPLLGHDFFQGWQYNIDLKERKLWLLRR